MGRLPCFPRLRGVVERSAEVGATINGTNGRYRLHGRVEGVLGMSTTHRGVFRAVAAKLGKGFGVLRCKFGGPGHQRDFQWWTHHGSILLAGHDKRYPKDDEQMENH